MSSDLALRVEGLSKRYTIRHKDHDHATLAQAALHRIRHPRGAAGREEFWALRDVSFEVPRGQVLGVIGHNGAGKSTLLKVLSRITPPSTGRVEVFGRIGSLLEVGTGFHPELTGRENIYLNGSILGMRKREINRQFDAIVDFSGIEQFLDTPVKRFSSGMYVRLAFSVAAHLDTDILLLDEVLAVGDAEFQKKCLGKMGEAAAGGRTVLLVSHNLASVEQMAGTALFLDKGIVGFFGNCSRALASYRSGSGQVPSGPVDLVSRSRADQNLPRTLELLSAELAGVNGPVPFGNVVRLIVRVRVGGKFDYPNLALSIVRQDGLAAGTAYGIGVGPLTRGAVESIEVTLPTTGLAPGTYSIDLITVDGDPQRGVLALDKVVGALSLEVAAVDGTGAGWGQWWHGLGSVRFADLELRRGVTCK